MSRHRSDTIDGVEVLSHPVISDALATLRAADTPTALFRTALRTVARGLVYEGTRFLPVCEKVIRTPLEETTVRTVGGPIVAVPILRAGLGMLGEFLELVPSAAAGFIGLKRDETTLVAGEYYRNLPEIAGSSLFVLDPMTATGGSVIAALRVLDGVPVHSRTLLSVVAAPEGLMAIRREFRNLRIVVAALDRELNSAGFILPGLGDAGDRLWATR